MKKKMVKDLVLQTLAHERGGVQVYETALGCVQRKGLRTEWDEYLDQTRTHVEILQRMCAELQIDPDEETAGVRAARHLCQALVEAMKLAKKDGDAAAAEIAAAECVVLAETRDHANWQLLSQCIGKLDGSRNRAMENAVAEVEDEQDEHLYHTRGWCRELWLQALGLASAFPSPEERRSVTTMVEAKVLAKVDTRKIDAQNAQLAGERARRAAEKRRSGGSVGAKLA